MEEKTKGIVMVIAAMAIFASIGLYVRFLDVPAIVITFASFLVAAVGIGLYLFVMKPGLIKVKQKLGVLLLLGAAGALNNFFFYQAFLHTTIANTVVTHYTMPLFVAILAPFILQEKLAKSFGVALLLSLIGIVLVSSGSFSLQSSDTVGILYGLGSGLMYGLIVVIARYLAPTYRALTITLYLSLFAALFSAPFAVSIDYAYTTTSILGLLGFGVLFGIIATTIHIGGMRRLPAQMSSILAYTEPVLAPIYALIFFAEIPSMFAVLGGILIIASGVIIIKTK